MTFQSVVGLSVVEAMQINKPVMLGNVARIVFEDEIKRPTHNFETVEDRHFGVLRALLIAMAFDVQVNGKTLNIRVQIQNEVGESTARKHILETASMKLISEGKAPNDARESIYRFAPGVQKKLTEFSKIELKIAEVVKVQVANPTDPLAGSDMISDDVYFNVIHPDVRQLAKDAISEKRDQKNRSKEAE